MLHRLSLTTRRRVLRGLRVTLVLEGKQFSPFASFTPIGLVATRGVTLIVGDCVTMGVFAFCCRVSFQYGGWGVCLH